MANDLQKLEGDLPLLIGIFDSLWLNCAFLELQQALQHRFDVVIEMGNASHFKVGNIGSRVIVVVICVVA